MTTAGAVHRAALVAIEDLSRFGSHLVAHEDFSSLTGASPGDWQRFAQNWNDLKLDTFMADGGTYRYRRYSQFEIDVESGTITQHPHGPYRQEEDVNKLNGGIDRLYDPLTDAFVGDPLFRSVLVELAAIFSGVDGSRKWNVKATPIRIMATQDELGQPTPEGRHRDGATFITSLMIGRENVMGGQSSVYTDDGECLVSATLSEPGDILLSDDRRTVHDVTALRPKKDGPGHRDVLILAYTSLSTDPSPGRNDVTDENRPVVTGCEHIGIQVRDVDRSARFYEQHLGFTMLARLSKSEPYVQRVVGYPGVTLEIALLAIPGTDVQLEILEYRGVERTPVDPATAHPGTAHFSLFVNDVDGLYARLRAQGVEFVSEVQTASAGPTAGGRLVYMKDPDGIRVELVQLAAADS